MQPFLQTLQAYDNGILREYYPWEYDAEAQQCLERGNKPSYFVTEEDCKFYQQQAEILQDRAAYIRQEWAKQEAFQSTQLATQSTTQQATQPSTKPVTQPITQSVTQPATHPITQPITQLATQPVTQLATQPEHSVEQEEEPQQANAENTAEKPSDNEATTIKNMALLSTIPRQIATQQAENDTTIWPAISACLGDIVLIWHIIELTIQEKDLLRRSQPNHYGYGNWTSAEGHRTMHIWTN